MQINPHPPLRQAKYTRKNRSALQPAEGVSNFEEVIEKAPSRKHREQQKPPNKSDPTHRIDLEA